MADNLTINVSSGTAVVATDQDPSAPSEHYQVMKLAAGQADSVARIAGVSKGVQPVTPDVALAVQALKDSGRTAVMIVADAYPVASTAEALVNVLAAFEAFVAAGTGLSDYTVPVGKTLRIQLVTVHLNSVTSNTGSVDAEVRVRVNPAGAVGSTSPIALNVWVQGQATANNASAAVVLPVTDGLELAAGMHVGVTVLCPGFVATTQAPKISVTIVGYLY